MKITDCVVYQLIQSKIERANGSRRLTKADRMEVDNALEDYCYLEACEDSYELLKSVTEIEQAAGSPCPLCGGGFNHKDHCIIPQAEQIIAKSETRRNNE